MYDYSNYKNILRNYFKDSQFLDDTQKQLAYDAIDDYIFFMDRIDELKKLPYIRIDSRNPAKQQLTPAAKLVKEYSQSVDNKRRVLLAIAQFAKKEELRQKRAEEKENDEDNVLADMLARFGEL